PGAAGDTSPTETEAHAQDVPVPPAGDAEVPAPGEGVPGPVAAETDADAEAPAQEVQAHATGHAAQLPVGPVPADAEEEDEGSRVLPHASVVPNHAFPVRMAGIGITLVGVASYIGGQLVMDAADQMPAGAERSERVDFGRSIRGGGLGAVITGVSIWLISNELARWNDAPPATIGFVPVQDGGAVTFSMRLP